MKAEYAGESGSLQRDSVEREEYAEAQSAEQMEILTQTKTDKRLAQAGYFDILDKYESLHR